MNKLKITEEIIIDGVNVKDCKRRIGKNNYCRYYKRPCAENNYNCIWKKYYRKERECQELKNKIEFMEEYIKTVENARDELEKENVEIRKYQYEQDFLQQQLDQLKAKNEELKQTLIEIQQDLEFATYCESQECGCDDANECLECTKNQILQKISECEV